MRSTKYDIKKKGDKIIMVDDRLRGIIWFAIVLLILFALISLLILSEGLVAVAIMVGVLGGFFFIFFWALERTYTITPEYISIGYGLFIKKLRYNKIKSYSNYSSDALSIYYGRGKEIVVQFMYLPMDAKEYFVKALKRHHVPEETTANALDEFKMCYLMAYSGVFLFIGGAIAGNWYLIKSVLENGPYDHESHVALALVLVVFDLIFFYMACAQGQVIYVHGSTIDVRVFGIKVKSFDVKDISWVHTELVHHRTKNGGYSVDEMEVHMGDKTLFLLSPISRNFCNYDRFQGYLMANKIPFSLDKNELKLHY